jgi:hypothetical protein
MPVLTRVARRRLAAALGVLLLALAAAPWPSAWTAVTSCPAWLAAAPHRVQQQPPLPPPAGAAADSGGVLERTEQEETPRCPLGYTSAHTHQMMPDGHPPVW